MRGYLLTLNPGYLTPYQDGPQALERTLDALRADVWTSVDQREAVEHLALLVDMRWSLLSRAIERGIPADADLPDGGPGKQVTDDLRTRIMALRTQTQAEIDATQDGAFERFGDARAM
ncbi:CHASE3 domain-containing protein, partial [Arthrospira platensis SPKY1]|nr:CHASE3 domain-containing protein [Arthrospira platensis SPKY1]